MSPGLSPHVHARAMIVRKHISRCPCVVCFLGCWFVIPHIRLYPILTLQPLSLICDRTPSQFSLHSFRHPTSHTHQDALLKSVGLLGHVEQHVLRSLCS
jgi:hypothetical protein